jgi:hypothetical protein
MSCKLMSGFSEFPLFAGVTFQKTKEIFRDLSIQTCLHNLSACYFAKCMFRLWYFTLLCQSLKSDACWCRSMAMARGPGLQVFTFHRRQVHVWQCPHHTQTRCHSWTLCPWPQGLVSVTVYKSWTVGRSSAQFISIPDQRISIKFGVVVHTNSCHIQFWPILHAPIHYLLLQNLIWNYRSNDEANYTKQDTKYIKTKNHFTEIVQNNVLCTESVQCRYLLWCGYDENEAIHMPNTATNAHHS